MLLGTHREDAQEYNGLPLLAALENMAWRRYQSCQQRATRTLKVEHIHIFETILQEYKKLFASPQSTFALRKGMLLKGEIYASDLLMYAINTRNKKVFKQILNLYDEKIMDLLCKKEMTVCQESMLIRTIELELPALFLALFNVYNQKHPINISRQYSLLNGIAEKNIKINAKQYHFFQRRNVYSAQSPFFAIWSSFSTKISTKVLRSFNKNDQKIILQGINQHAHSIIENFAIFRHDDQEKLDKLQLLLNELLTPTIKKNLLLNNIPRQPYSNSTRKQPSAITHVFKRDNDPYKIENSKFMLLQHVFSFTLSKEEKKEIWEGIRDTIQKKLTSEAFEHRLRFVKARFQHNLTDAGIDNLIPLALTSIIIDYCFGNAEDHRHCEDFETCKAIFWPGNLVFSHTQPSLIGPW